MATENADLMKNARTSLEGKWGLAIATFFVYMVIISAAQALVDFEAVTSLATLVIAGPFAVGAAIFSLNISRGGEAKLEQIFDGFKNFATALVAYLLMFLFVFLWALLFIIPGVIAALSYAMTFFIIADDPQIRPRAALDKSKAMMDGYKAKLFRMYLRFFGWSLLCLLTFGIGFLFLFPYMYVSLAKFYDDVKADSAGGSAQTLEPENPPEPSSPPEPTMNPEPIVPDGSTQGGEQSSDPGTEEKPVPKRGFDYEK